MFLFSQLMSTKQFVLRPFCQINCHVFFVLPPLPQLRVLLLHVCGVDSLQSVLESLLSSEQSMVELIARFQEYMEYDDVRYLSLKYCHTTVKERKTQVGASYSSKVTLW